MGVELDIFYLVFDSDGMAAGIACRMHIEILFPQSKLRQQL